MGFGYNIFCAIFLLPVTGLLLLAWLLIRNSIFGKTLGIIWLAVFVLPFFSMSMELLTAKKKLQKDDYYGEYIIDRDYFPGKQADWQYENFRFEIRSNDSIYFYVTSKEQVVKIFRGTISTIKPYTSERLVINMQQPTHHILTSNPTIYRSAWNFCLVFNSPKFNNVYFKKGNWMPLD